MTTGVETRRGSAFISARVSRPFFRGMFTSIKTRAARIPGRRRRWSSAMPSGSHTRACPLPARFQASSSSRKSGGLSSATSTGQLVLTFIRYGFSHWYLSTRVGRPVAPVLRGGTDDRLLSSNNRASARDDKVEKARRGTRPRDPAPRPGDRHDCQRVSGKERRKL